MNLFNFSSFDIDKDSYSFCDKSSKLCRKVPNINYFCLVLYKTLL